VLRILKNRHGPAPKTITLHFEPKTLRIRPSGGLAAPASAAPRPTPAPHSEACDCDVCVLPKVRP
jgi:hypothetical protein